MNRKTTISGLALLSVCLAGCASKQTGASASQKLTPDQQTAKTRLDSITAQTAQTAQNYKAMDNTTLLGKLSEQSAMKKEPFNSPAYRELKGRTDVDPAALVALVRKTPTGDSLLPLLLLRKQNTSAYEGIPAETRAAVLTDALNKSVTFNVWGIPDVYLEDASKAMIETGKSTVPALKRMLSDTRPAPIYGSQEVTVAERYHYRLCDYAYFFLQKIQGNTDLRMPMAPADRDALIKKMM